MVLIQSRYPLSKDGARLVIQKIFTSHWKRFTSDLETVISVLCNPVLQTFQGPRNVALPAAGIAEAVGELFKPRSFVHVFMQI